MTDMCHFYGSPFCFNKFWATIEKETGEPKSCKIKVYP